MILQIEDHKQNTDNKPPPAGRGPQGPESKGTVPRPGGRPPRGAAPWRVGVCRSVSQVVWPRPDELRPDRRPDGFFWTGLFLLTPTQSRRRVMTPKVRCNSATATRPPLSSQPPKGGLLPTTKRGPQAVPRRCRRGRNIEETS